MTRMLFNDNANVEIQGKEAFELVSFDSEQATYDLIGFVKPFVKIIDHRPDGLSALSEYLLSQGAYDFANFFCKISYVTLCEETEGNILIELYPPTKLMSDYTLWVSIGIDGRVPIYNYGYYEYQQMNDGKFAFLSIIQYEPNSLVQEDCLLSAS